MFRDFLEFPDHPGEVYSEGRIPVSQANSNIPDFHIERKFPLPCLLNRGPRSILEVESMVNAFEKLYDRDNYRSVAGEN